MQDDRKQLSDYIRNVLVQHNIDPHLVAAIIDQELAHYNVERCSCELATPVDTNNQILKLYRTSLMLSGRREKTISMYEYTLSTFASTCSTDLLHVSSFDVQRYLGYLLMNNRKASYVDGIRQTLSAFYGWANKKMLMQTNPMDMVDKVSCHKEQEQPFSSTDVATMRDVTNVRDRAVIEFLLSTGARVSELCNVKLSDVDFTTGSVKIVEGKGGKSRIVYLTPVALKYVKEYLSQYGLHETLFVGMREPHNPCTPHGIQRMLTRISSSTGIENIHPHRFRHTCATNLARSGMPIQEVQKYLGHSKIDTTMIYVTVSDDSLKASFDRYAVL